MCYPQVSYFGSSKFLKKITREKYNGINVKIKTFVKMGGVEIRISPETELIIYVRHRANYVGI